jgi:hypothetical protein
MSIPILFVDVKRKSYWIWTMLVGISPSGNNGQTIVLILKHLYSRLNVCLAKFSLLRYIFNLKSYRYISKSSKWNLTAELIREITQTSILMKFDDNSVTHVASRVLTRFFFQYLGSDLVFEQRWLIFELDLEFMKTNLQKNVQDIWISAVATKE